MPSKQLHMWPRSSPVAIAPAEGLKAWRTQPSSDRGAGVGAVDAAAGVDDLFGSPSSCGFGERLGAAEFVVLVARGVSEAAAHAACGSEVAHDAEGLVVAPFEVLRVTDVAFDEAEGRVALVLGRKNTSDSRGQNGP